MGIRQVLQYQYKINRVAEWPVVQFSQSNKLNPDDLDFLGDKHLEKNKTRTWQTLGVVSLGAAGFIVGFGAGITHSRLAAVASENGLTDTSYMYDDKEMHAQVYQENRLPQLISHFNARQNLTQALLASVEGSCSSEGRIFVYPY